MTVSVAVSENVFTGNSATTEFPTTVYALADSTITVKTRVIATGVETTRALGADYTISGLGAASGITINYPLSGSPLPATQQLIVTRTVPYTQQTDIANQDGFLPEVIEQALDTVVLQIQQVADEVNRGIVVPVGEEAITLPTAINRANKYLVFDADGDATVTSIVTGSVTVTSYMETVLDAADATEAKTLLEIGAGSNDQVSVSANDTTQGYLNGKLVAGSAITFTEDNDAGDETLTVSITDSAITTAKINDDAVTLAKMASGTAGNLITYNASGDPAAVATGSSGQVLTSNGAGAAPSFQTPASGGGMTLLGSIVITSGTSHSLGSLTLTGYKALKIFLNGVDGASSLNVAIDGTIFTATTGSPIYGTVDLELVAGTGSGIGGANGSFVSLVGLNTSYSTATTTITFTTSSAANAGTIYVYGVK